MSKKITYLFGAGASADILPVVERFPDFLKGKKNKLSSNEFNLDSTSKFEDFEQLKLCKRDYQKELINIFEWIETESRRHASVDTFAKKLFLKEDFKALKKLKIGLSLYFILEQSGKRPDKRYDTFFSSILDHLDVFPKNIRILSWNYDNQFELAYSDFHPNKTIDDIDNRLGLYSKFRVNFYDSGFGIFKLNGSTDFRASNLMKTVRLITPSPEPLNIQFIENLVKIFALTSELDLFQSNLSFAWESDTNQSDIVNIALENIVETQILVVIGYSFPFFNRVHDIKLFRNLEKLEKVYFQDLNPEPLIDRFISINDSLDKDSLVPIKNTKQFYLPFEL